MLKLTQKVIALIIVLALFINYIGFPMDRVMAESEHKEIILFQNDEVSISTEINTEFDKNFVRKFQTDDSFRRKKIDEFLEMHSINKKNIKKELSTMSTSIEVCLQG